MYELAAPLFFFFKLANCTLNSISKTTGLVPNQSTENETKQNSFLPRHAKSTLPIVSLGSD